MLIPVRETEQIASSVRVGLAACDLHV
jgi:hypothetical protein